MEYLDKLSLRQKINDAALALAGVFGIACWIRFFIYIIAGNTNPLILYAFEALVFTVAFIFTCHVDTRIKNDRSAYYDSKLKDDE